MTTKKQIEANRRNAQLSTGPTTAAGLAQSSKNALKHGLTAKDVTLDGDEAMKFAAFRDDIIHDLAPVGALEEEFAQHIALLFWRRRRVASLEVTEPRCSSEGECDAKPPLHNFISDGFNKLMRYDASLDRALQRALRDLERLQARRREEADPDKYINHRIPVEIDGDCYFIQAAERWVKQEDGINEVLARLTGDELDQIMPKLAEQLNKDRAERAR